MSTQILSLIDNVPTAISGTILNDIVDRTRLFMESWTNETIGSVGIAEKYQPGLVDLSVAELLGFMETTGTDVSNVRLGDLSIGKGAGGNLATAKEYFHQRGMKMLSTYGTRVPFYAAYG